MRDNSHEYYVSPRQEQGGKFSNECVLNMRLWIHQLLSWLSRDAQEVGQEVILCCCKTILVWACYAVSLPGLTAVSECVCLYTAYACVL